MDHMCGHVTPFDEPKSEYEEWAEKGCDKAKELIEKTKKTQ